MRRKIKKIFIYFLTIIIIFINTSCFSFAESNTQLPSDIYMKQMGSGYCTLASACMMMRSKAYLENNASWPNLTQQAIRSTAWAPGLYRSRRTPFCRAAACEGHARRWAC